MRDEYAEGRSQDASIVAGVREWARAVTTAGIIILVVFRSFAATLVLVTEELGLVLAAAVLFERRTLRFALVLEGEALNRPGNRAQFEHVQPH